ncbi:MAG: hypothetical protein HOP32_17465 [Nitrospira sp.]|nr:hypothetical protein [Nitrospira sp.]
MTEIEDKYALFALSDDMRKHLVELAQVQTFGKETPKRVIMETVVVQHGDRTVIDREERGG